MLNFFGVTIGGGMLTFSITYILSDVFSEVYGYAKSRQISFIASGINLLFGLIIILVVRLPQPEWYDGSHFAIGIGSSLRIVLSSSICYVVGDFVNDKIFEIMRRRNDGLKGFRLRALISSVCGNIVDTVVFVVLAFTWVIPVEEMIPMILVSVVLKSLYELLILPVTYAVVKKIKEVEQ
jgi:uncharacterized integral membrane protein (TIGR00697 family)